MKPLSPDTTPGAQRMHYQMMGQLSPERRLELALALTDDLRRLIIEEVKLRYPQGDEIFIKRKFIARMLPRETVISVYGFDPNSELP